MEHAIAILEEAKRQTLKFSSPTAKRNAAEIDTAIKALRKAKPNLQRCEFNTSLFGILFFGYWGHRGYILGVYRKGLVDWHSKKDIHIPRWLRKLGFRSGPRKNNKLKTL